MVAVPGNVTIVRDRTVTHCPSGQLPLCKSFYVFIHTRNLGIHLSWGTLNLPLQVVVCSKAIGLVPKL